MTNFYRLMLGQGSAFAEQCFEFGFIGVDFNINVDLSSDLADDWRDFNKLMIPRWMETHPDKTKVAAGLACGALWTVSKGIQRGDVVLSPDGNRRYRFGVVTGDYRFAQATDLPHQREIDWSQTYVNRDQLSQPLRNSLGSIGTVCNVTKYAEELTQYFDQGDSPAPPPAEQGVSNFQMEKHLEDFLIENWSGTHFGQDFNLFELNGEELGQQFLTDTGPLDILATSKDAKTLLVIELKKGRASDQVVGQILRYMSYIKEDIAGPDQIVKGAIVALEDDKRLRRALSMVPDVEFFRYEVSFSMTQVET